MGVRISFSQEELLGLPYWTTISAICVLESVSIRLDIPTSEFFSNFGASSIFTWVQADIASAACPSQSGCRAMTSITYAAVICDADEPCSVNTA